jgi:molybdopterin converting factor small subunit
MAAEVRIRLFATARELAGRPSLRWSVPEAGVPAGELVKALGDRFPRLVPTLRTSRFLRNDRYLRDLREVVRPGDEFAVHPPYGGG